MQYFFQNIGNPESEERMLRFSLDVVPEPEKAGAEENIAWKRKPGADEILDYFYGSKKIEISQLRNYLQGLPDEKKNLGVNVDIRNAFADLDKGASAVKESTQAEKNLNRLCRFLESRNSVVKEAHAKLKQITVAPKELPGSIELAKNKITDALGACVDGFQNATGQEKAVMLAGAVAAFLMLRNIMQGTEGKMPNSTKFLKNTLKLAGGGFLGYMALQAVNKSVEKTRGRPLIDHQWLGGKGGFTSISFPALNPISSNASRQNQWNTEVFGQTVDAVRDDLQHGQNEVLQDIFVSEKIESADAAKKEGIDEETFQRKRRGYVAGMMNLSTLDVSSFQRLYEESRASNKSTSESVLGYPRKPFKNDGLTAAERFALIESIAFATQTIDPATHRGVDLPANKKNKSMLYFMLDI